MAKQNKEKTALPSKYFLTIMAVVCVLLMFISYIADFSMGPFSLVTNYVFVPMQKGLTAIGSSISVSSNEAKTKEELISEIEELNEQVDELNARLNSTLMRLNQLEDYEKLFSLSNQYTDYEMTGARIIGAATTNWFDTFTIDKGTNDGIAVNMNVIADQGLVGIVIDTKPDFSIVRTIIDDSSNVSAMISSTNDNCIVSGSLRDVIESNFINYSNLYDSSDAVSIGDYVVTSNISDKYVPGLLIGYVSSIEKDSNDLTKSGTITPVVDFKHLSTVLVIKTLKENYSNGDQTETQESN